MQSIDRSFDVTAKGVSVGNVFQGFGTPFVSRAPNEREIRNMTLQGVSCGIRMAGWWAFGTMRGTIEWPVYREMVSRCRDVAPFLWGVNPDRRRDGDVVFSRFVSRRGTVVIAVNLADKSATAALPWPDTPESEMPFGFGVKRDGLSLEIEPYGCALWKSAAHDDLVRRVDPFVGTTVAGHTTPAACVPFGLVQAGPDTGNNSWHYCSGYRYEDGVIAGFSQTHLSGTGNAELGDVRILPFRGSLPVPSAFSHDEEIAEPGFYSVMLKDASVRVDVSVSGHAAIYRIRGTGIVRLLVDCLHGLTELDEDPSKDVVKSDVKLTGTTGLEGTVSRVHWVARDCSFAVVFNRQYLAEKKLSDGRHVFDFEMNDGQPIIVKIGLSAEGGVEAAKQNLAAEIPGWDFDAVKSAAREKWNDVLARAQVEGSDEQKKNWYTSLYHLFTQPNNIADVGEKPFYSTFSLWDTFRAAHPMYTILAPEKVPGMVDSMLEQGKRTGYLPIWTLWGKENQGMIGTHSVPVIVDWFLKSGNGEWGTGNGYWIDAYAQIKETLTKRHDGRLKERWDLLDKYGYYPFDIIKGESVSRTMECAYDDWCAGVMAEKLGERGTGNGERDKQLKADAEFFFKRSQNWKNVFDPSIGLVRGRDSKGNWREPYDPYLVGHNTDTANDFTEGNAFQYTWHVMHDPIGLMKAMGGNALFVKKLDALFAAPEKVEGDGCVVDVTGLIGQYVHGNEPSHHVIYFYPQIGHPEKAAERIREVFDKFYLPKPDGLCGNDDCGQMSAWYLFSAMGFYPFNPCGGEYVIGAPQVPRIELMVGRDDPIAPKIFTIIARNLSRENKYVKSVSLNGKPVTDWKIRHPDIMAGGELVFEMESR